MPSEGIWRRAKYEYEQAAERAPDGFEPVVEVYLAGRTEPMVPGFVEVRHDGWVRLEAEVKGAEPDDEAPIPEDCFWLHVPESCVLGIEIRYRKAGAGPPLGFSYVESGE